MSDDRSRFGTPREDLKNSQAAEALRKEAALSSDGWRRETERAKELGLEAAPSIGDRTISTFSRGELPHFAGINTFLKAPYVEDVQKAGDFDVAVFSIGGWQVPRDGVKVCRERGTTILTITDVMEMGIDKALDIALEVATNGTEAVYLSFDIDKVDAVAVWEPNKSQLLAKLPGSHVVFDSRSLPGQIPDLLVFQSKVVDARPQDVQGIVDAWYDTMAWWRAHPDDAVKIMADTAKDPGTPAEQVAFYKSFIKGTRIFDGPEALAAFTKSGKPTSLYASGPSITQFLLDQKQIPKLPDFTTAIDPTFVTAAVKKGEGKQPPYDYTLKVN